ncbi:alkaline phosphatase D family protein [Sinosporangium siamense]|uniref:Metallophosphatase n=1 Tax=Sinosporangium siamense TaxID=1367973 RepID=A0A919V3Y8_9ACTN|nr:alkaline phosphatase D family protein [Sinosporangium siamense]GII89988.1 metallophosphatase [Sinosporangium siamense]
MVELLVGPMLRYVDSTCASIWVETSEPCTVRVTAGEASAEARTFTVHGHHYAVVDLDRLTSEPVAYSVALQGRKVWPVEGMPPSVVRAMPEAGPRRVVFGSCRSSLPHDAPHIESHGVDMLHEYAIRMAASPVEEWPDLLLMIGDQVYADEPTGDVLEAIRERRKPGEEPVDELADFDEYAALYRQAWGDPEVRWLLSTLSSAMIFDDHDLRDDWNTSASWRAKMAQVSWWPRRVAAGLGSYWVYQHLGNLSPAERGKDPVLAAIRALDGDGAELLDAFALRADAEPEGTRWSYARDMGSVRLIMLDTRAARRLTPGDRRMVDTGEWEWLAEQVVGARSMDNLLIGSSVPVLLPVGIHHVESWNEALCDGAWGKRVARWAEAVRQMVDLEHWAAFRRSFEELSRMLVACGTRVILLSGDVHYSYLARLRGGRVYQVVCSPIRNPLGRLILWANVVAGFGIAGAGGWVLARLARVPRPPYKWKIDEGPWFHNALSTVELRGLPTIIWEGPADGPDRGSGAGIAELHRATLEA